MPATLPYPHLQLDRNGEVLVAGTRYKAKHIAAEHFQFGWSAEELLRQHPDLRPEQVYSVLTWFYDHHAEVIEQLTTEFERLQKPDRFTHFSRAELMQRKGQIDGSST
jgi:uncharacterized protein (DUF433 family)